MAQLQSRLDSEKSLEDSRFEELMAAISKQPPLKEKLVAAASTSAAAPQQGALSSGMLHNPSSISFGSPPFTHILSSSNKSPAHHSSPLSRTPTQSIPPPPRNTTISNLPPFTSLSSSYIPAYLHSTIPTLHSTIPTSTPIPYSIPPASSYTATLTPHSAPLFSQMPFTSNSNIPPLPPFRTPKLELAAFDGSNPLEWLFQADQFFGFYNFPPENRLSLISFYMKGDALSWFKWMHHNNLLTDWGSFVRELELRFGPSTFDNHQAELFKLKQEGSVMDYQSKFEKLCNQVVGLPHDAVLNCFISGLKSEIKNEMAIHHPRTISQAIGLAKLIESKIQDTKPKIFKPYSNSSNRNLLFNKPTITHTPPSTPAASSNSTYQPSKLPIRKLSSAQLQERRAQGLCFNCDEKFVVGHKCSTSRFLLLLADDENLDATYNDEPQPDAIADPDSNDTYFQLSPQALTGQFSPQTLKFQGYIGGLPVMVLVDTGSTHNILQPRIAQHLNLPTKPIPHFSVMVGNGSHLQCEGISNGVQLTLQNKTFTLPFYLLPIEGADVVLGMAWLRTLGQITADFSVPSITFTHKDSPITLKGDPKTLPTLTTFHQLRHLIHTNSVASFHLMTFIQHETPNPNPPNLHEQADFPSSLNPPKFKPPSHEHNQQINPHITSLIQKYPTVFQGSLNLPPPRPFDHRIPLLPNSPPINVKPYRYPHCQKEAMTSLIQDMLKEGLIVPSNSPFSSPVLLVKKKDGTWRFCVDYRALNAVTIKDRFPIPTIDELLDELGNETIFTKINLRLGYHQIRVATEDTHKTAFRTFDGHYEFLVMPFGLTNAPSTFQSAMNELLRPYLRKFVLVFFDDILIFSSSLSDHLVHLDIIFNALKSNSFVAKFSKCVFAVDKVHYLGHVISAGNVAADPEKIQAILDWPVPRSLTALRGFLGLTGFYRRFVRHYATLAAPLTDLLRSTTFSWSTEASLAFTELKHKMTDMPVLALPDFTKSFIIETDASGVTIGAVLSQGGHPLAFFSKKMCPRMQSSSVYVREMYAVTESVKKWRQYLIGQKFQIYTDQKSLKDLLMQRIQTPEQQKWASKLQGFNFEIFYKPGRSNLVADALSRKFSTKEPLFMALTSAVPELIHHLRHYYTSDLEGQQLVQNLLSRADTDFSFIKKLLFFKNKMYIPSTQLRLALIDEFHSTPTSGHSGVKPTVARLTASFAWPRLHSDVKDFIKHCTICQQSKYQTQKKQGLLQPLPIPAQVWEELTMDFITKLPNSFGHTVIWVICDRLTKYVHFIALPTNFTAQDIAARFSVEVCRLHGIPKSIVSDRDPLFVSTFWKQLFKIQGTKLKFSTAYHPKTDGQSEVVNRSLETYLRCFVSDHPKQWFKFLHLAEFWFNTSYHSAIKMSPFMALYGRPPPAIPDYIKDSASIESLDSSLQQRKEILDQLRLNLQRSRKQMETQANKSRRELTFNVGDSVLLRLRPYRQHSVTKRSSKKLSKYYHGPYTVVKRVGEVAYELDLPSSSKIHPVVHVSLLRPFFEASSTFNPLDLPLHISKLFLQNQEQSKTSQPQTPKQNSSSNLRENKTLPAAKAGGSADTHMQQALQLPTEKKNLQQYLESTCTSTANSPNESASRVKPPLITQHSPPPPTSHVSQTLKSDRPNNNTLNPPCIISTNNPNFPTYPLSYPLPTESQKSASIQPLAATSPLVSAQRSPTVKLHVNPIPPSQCYTRDSHSSCTPHNFSKLPQPWAPFSTSQLNLEDKVPFGSGSIVSPAKPQPIKMSWQGKRVYVVNVYAPCTLDKKKEMWMNLREKRNSFQDGEWCFWGDFNAVSNRRERLGIGA
ncbi:uncharacterized protein LOC131640216 [Vicia villosa]|uniref:uncharacterized protein LOC131640216 n=1 Tax=Vicia villosa TaxID=3911 RepID=UPI00273BD809|nr:uncharacterized protein LOC131640216 [Vicia villosa]